MEKTINFLINLIENRNSSSIFELVLNRIDEFSKGKSNMPFPEWYYLTIIELAIEHSSDSSILLVAKNADIDRMLEFIQEIGSKYINENFGFSDSISIRKSMSVIQNQQFWIYNLQPAHDIARQLYLFVDLDTDKKEIQNLFQEKYKLDLVSFLHLCNSYYLNFKNDNIITDEKIIEDLNKTFGEEQHKIFLDLLTFNTSVNFESSA